MWPESLFVCAFNETKPVLPRISRTAKMCPYRKIMRLGTVSHNWIF